MSNQEKKDGYGSVTTPETSYKKDLSQLESDKYSGEIVGTWVC